MSRRPRVLVVDDDVATRTLLQRMLDHLGFDAAVAGDGNAAILAAATGAYDIILMDGSMPGLDGYETTRRIRAAEHGRRVPIISISGVDPLTDQPRATEAGMDGHLSKPMSLEELRAVLQTALGDS